MSQGDDESCGEAPPSALTTASSSKSVVPSIGGGEFENLHHNFIFAMASRETYSYFNMLKLKEISPNWKEAMSTMTMKPYPILVSLSRCKNIHEEFVLYDMNSKSPHKMEKSPWLGEQYSCCHIIIGSRPDGWVIVLDKKKVPYLLHLFLEIRIQLPATKGSLVQTDEKVDIVKAILSSNGSNRPEDLTVVIAYCNKLAFWRYGDCQWTCFESNNNLFVLDIAFSKDDILYAIRSEEHGLGYNKYLESWDMKRSNLNSPEKMLTIYLSGNYALAKRLVVSLQDEIFLWNTTYSSKSKCLIYKFDSGTNECTSAAESLNGRTLFSCLVDSVILSAIDVEHLGFKANSIYFEEGLNIKSNIFSFDDQPKNINIWDQFHEPPQQPSFGLFLLTP